MITTSLTATMLPFASAATALPSFINSDAMVPFHRNPRVVCDATNGDQKPPNGADGSIEKTGVDPSEVLVRVDPPGSLADTSTVQGLVELLQGKDPLLLHRHLYKMSELSKSARESGFYGADAIVNGVVIGIWAGVSLAAFCLLAYKEYGLSALVAAITGLFTLLGGPSLGAFIGHSWRSSLIQAEFQEQLDRKFIGYLTSDDPKIRETSLNMLQGILHQIYSPKEREIFLNRLGKRLPPAELNEITRELRSLALSEVTELAIEVRKPNVTAVVKALRSRRQKRRRKAETQVLTAIGKFTLEEKIELFCKLGEKRLKSREAIKVAYTLFHNIPTDQHHQLLEAIQNTKWHMNILNLYDYFRTGGERLLPNYQAWLNLPEEDRHLLLEGPKEDD